MKKKIEKKERKKVEKKRRKEERIRKEKERKKEAEEKKRKMLFDRYFYLEYYNKKVSVSESENEHNEDEEKERLIEKESDLDKNNCDDDISSLSSTSEEIDFREETTSFAKGERDENFDREDNRNADLYRRYPYLRPSFGYNNNDSDSSDDENDKSEKINLPSSNLGSSYGDLSIQSGFYYLFYEFICMFNMRFV
jgi:hypothetical protein